MKHLWLGIPLTSILIVAMAASALAQTPPDRSKGLSRKGLEFDIQAARVGGKYQCLLRILRVPGDLERYGSFHDFGAWKGTEYAGHKDLPAGHWVYVHPHWFIWGALKPKQPFGPEQAVGPPDTLEAGRLETAWAPRGRAQDRFCLELGYEKPLRPVAVLVYVPIRAGSVSMISAFTVKGEEEVFVWRRTASVRGKTGVSVIPLTMRFETRRLKLYLKLLVEDAAIDAVGILDRSGITHWATSAKASSSVGVSKPNQPTKSSLTRAFDGRHGGRRGLRRRYGGVGTAEGVSLGLDWLARHQTPHEGYWDCDGYQEQCKGNLCDGKGYPLYDPGLTGLAILAFLGAGHTHQTGPYKKTVGDAIKFIRRIQDPEGCYGVQKGHFMYCHALCTLAMAEAYGMTHSPLLRRSVEKGLEFLYKAQNPNPSGSGKLAWRYTVQPGDNDTSVTGWAVLALKSAKMAGFDVPEEVLGGARIWVDQMTDPNTGRCGYVQSGVSPVRAPGREAKWPRSRSEAITAVAMLTRVFLGEDPDESKVIQQGARLCLERLPVWDEGNGSIDHYYWYFGTLAMFQVGGRQWQKWNSAMKKAIVDHQRKDGCEKGSWDPLGPWGEDGGRVYATAVMTMCLEVYYRYAKVSGSK